MKFKVQSIKDIGVVHTNEGDRCVEGLILEDEDGKIYKVLRWGKKSHIGDVLVGEIIKYRFSTLLEEEE